MIRRLIILLLIVGCDTKVCDFFLGNICESDESEVSADTEAVEGACPDKFCFPLDEYVVTLGFGEWHPDYWENEPAGLYHAAEDVAGDAGTPVYAIADGVMDYSGAWGAPPPGWSNTGDAVILINHQNPYIYSLYGHLSLSRWYKPIECLAGGACRNVKKGELIGYLADLDESGSFSEHLHFAIRTGNMTDYYKYSGQWEWRIFGGHTVGNPADVGWLHPSNFITEQNLIN